MHILHINGVLEKKWGVTTRVFVMDMYRSDTFDIWKYPAE